MHENWLISYFKSRRLVDPKWCQVERMKWHESKALIFDDSPCNESAPRWNQSTLALRWADEKQKHNNKWMRKLKMAGLGQREREEEGETEATTIKKNIKGYCQQQQQKTRDAVDAADNADAGCPETPAAIESWKARGLFRLTLTSAVDEWPTKTKQMAPKQRAHKHREPDRCDGCRSTWDESPLGVKLWRSRRTIRRQPTAKWKSGVNAPNQQLHICSATSSISRSGFSFDPNTPYRRFHPYFLHVLLFRPRFSIQLCNFSRCAIRSWFNSFKFHISYWVIESSSSILLLFYVVQMACAQFDSISFIPANSLFLCRK